MKVPSKIKVIQLVPELNSGGVERGTLEVGKYLSKQGHETIVVSNGGRMVTQLVDEGSTHIQMPIHKKTPLSLLQVFKLRKLFFLEKPDVVHARSRVPAWLCFFALKLVKDELRPKFVTTVHGFNSVNTYSEIMTKGDSVVCVSKSIRDHLLKNYPRVDPRKLSIINRGVSKEDFDIDLKPSEKWKSSFYESFPNSKGKKLLLLPGRVTQLKGHEDFLLIISKLPENYHGLIVGNIHPSKEKFVTYLKSNIDKLNLEKRVTFTGSRNDISNIYSIAFATLSLSKKPESFGRVVLESLSMGCPVFGYDQGGVGEILSHCFQDGLVKPNSLEGVVDKVFNLNKKNIRITIPNYYRLNVMNREILRIYERILY